MVPFRTLIHDPYVWLCLSFFVLLIGVILGVLIERLMTTK